jgi:uncharacterized repeat protein (TIGR03803 family)
MRRSTAKPQRRIRIISEKRNYFETIFDFAQSTGTFPYTNVNLDASGNVYGTTLQGGANCAPYGCGLVYELSAPASTQR